MTMIRPRSDVFYGICRGLPSDADVVYGICRGLPSDGRLPHDERLFDQLTSLDDRDYLYTYTSHVSTRLIFDIPVNHIHVFLHVNFKIILMVLYSNVNSLKLYVHTDITMRNGSISG